MMEHEKKDDVIEFKIPKFTTEKIRRNPWVISTFVFVVLSLVLMWNNYAGSGFGNISSEKASAILETFLSDSSGTQITVKNIVLENGLYKASVDYQGNEIALYMTKDGNYLIQDLIPLTNTNDDGENIGGLVSASEDDEAVLGDENAPVTIIEFSDYQCPFCRKFYDETLPSLKSEYIDKGKVKLIYRDYPLSSIHPQAQKAAEAAECAGEQNKYYEYHDKLFKNQKALDINNLKKYAKEIGLNTNDFNNCLDSNKMESEVQKDLEEGQDLGIQGTPAFFINGQPLMGAYPLEEFKKVI